MKLQSLIKRAIWVLLTGITIVIGSLSLIIIMILVYLIFLLFALAGHFEESIEEKDDFEGEEE